MNKIDKKINGEIELYRFLFCIGVLFFHAEKYFLGEPDQLGSLTPYFFVHGSIGVEFFFVCSGFFMAKSVKRRFMAGAPEDIGSGTLKFMWHKIRAILPMHIVFWVLSFISLVIARSWDIGTSLRKLTDAVPSFFLIQMLGFNGTSPNHVTWYLSVMLISMFVIYPFLRRYYSVVSKVFAPAAGMFILGHLYLKYGSLTGVMTVDGIFYKSMLRGFAEILIGICTYEIAEYVKASKPGRVKSLLFTVSAFVLLAVSGAYMMLTLSARFEFMIVFISAALLVIAYSGQGLLSGALNNRFTAFLGKLTLPVYLSQVVMINLICRFGADLSFGAKTGILAAGVLFLALCAVVLDKWISILHNNTATVP